MSTYHRPIDRRAEADGEDLYEVLELSPNARREVIQAAYRALARACHPDLNGSPWAEHRMRQLNGAYEVLNDPSRRAAYDIERIRVKRRALLMNAPAQTRRLQTRVDANGVPARRPARTHGEDRLWTLNSEMVVGLGALAVCIAVVFLMVWIA